jgi:hypothetical protein
LVLFGEYRGTVRNSGFHWGNPFYSNGPRINAAAAGGSDVVAKGAAAKAQAHQAGRRQSGRNKISLRARTLNGEKLKALYT